MDDPSCTPVTSFKGARAVFHFPLYPEEGAVATTCCCRKFPMRFGQEFHVEFLDTPSNTELIEFKRGEDVTRELDD